MDKQSLTIRPNEMVLPLRSNEDVSKAKLLIDYLNTLDTLLSKANTLSCYHSELEASIKRVCDEIERLLIKG